MHLLVFTVLIGDVFVLGPITTTALLVAVAVVSEGARTVGTDWQPLLTYGDLNISAVYETRVFAEVGSNALVRRNGGVDVRDITTVRWVHIQSVAQHQRLLQELKIGWTIRSPVLWQFSIFIADVSEHESPGAPSRRGGGQGRHLLQEVSIDALVAFCCGHGACSGCVGAYTPDVSYSTLTPGLGFCLILVFAKVITVVIISVGMGHGLWGEFP